MRVKSTDMQRFVICMLSFVWLGAFAPTTRADEAAVDREDQLKAAYVFNFMKFVQWQSAAPADVLTVCFVGARGVYAAFANGIEKKRAGSHQLAVRMLQATDEAGECHALYIEASALHDVALASDSDLPILTVSDAKSFASNGGIIELFASGNRLQFNINVAKAQKSGLRISSSLLQLAAAVDKDPS